LKKAARLPKRQIRHHNKVMLRKIITYFLILAVVLPIFASAVPFEVNVSYAQEGEDGTTRTTITKKGDTTTTVTEKTSNNGRINDPCDLWTIAGNGTVMECLSNTIANFLYDYVLQGAIVIAGLAGNLFNASIQFSLTGDIFDADKNIMIKDGWTMVRDLLNLVFIFILLYAAISTILQYGNMDIKKILPSLIIAALLINFSMLITKMVIDASHIFAWEFYNQIDVTKGGTVANMNNEINVYGDFEKKNLANVFIAGFNPQELLTGSDKDNSKSQWKQVLDDSISKGGTYTSTWWQMALILLLESALALFAGFILLAGAIMFVVRVVVLWLVIIFSPLAFLSMVLPSMEKYSKMWWEYLINQSFFAPAFLFMFMLVTKFINSDFVDSIFEVSSNSDLKIVLGLDGGKIALTFFHFFVVGGLMMACLIVARQLGGKTAEFGIGGAHRIKGWALGAPGKALKYGQYGVNNRLGRWAGGLAGDSNWWAKSIGRIPGGNILGRKLGAMKKADEDKARKAAEKYASSLSDSGFASLKKDTSKGFVKRFMYTGPEGAFPSSKKGYENVEKKKNAEELRKKTIEKEKIELDMRIKSQPFLDKMAEDSRQDIKIIDEDLDNIETELQRLNYELIEAVKNKDTTAIPNITIEINKEKVKRTTKVKEKELHTENIKNAENNETKADSLKEKAERRKETEGLQETIKASGSGGVGGGGKGGGGKTPP